MTANEIVQAVAQRLQQLYPDGRVHTQSPPAETEGEMYVHCTRQSREQGLGRRCIDTFTIEVRRYQTAPGGTAAGDWAQAVLDELQLLTAGQTVLHLRDRAVAETAYGSAFTATVQHNSTERQDGGNEMAALDQSTHAQL